MFFTVWSLAPVARCIASYSLRVVTASSQSPTGNTAATLPSVINKHTELGNADTYEENLSK